MVDGFSFGRSVGEAVASNIAFFSVAAWSTQHGWEASALSANLAEQHGVERSRGVEDIILVQFYRLHDTPA